MGFKEVVSLTDAVAALRDGASCALILTHTNEGRVLEAQILCVEAQSVVLGMAAEFRDWRMDRAEGFFRLQKTFDFRGIADAGGAIEYLRETTKRNLERVVA